MINYLFQAAILFHNGILPLVGSNPYDAEAKTTTTSTDMYISTLHKLVIIQLRSPIMKVII